MESSLIFYVNGTKIIEKQPDPECTLAYYLRTKLYLSGTKIGCGEGECGSCTVMISKYDNRSNSVKHYAVPSCLTLLVSLNGCAVTTVEGIGSLQNGLHPVQERLARRHGVQCGFCSPGFVMSMYTLLRNIWQPSKEEIERAVEGNLCRCTGYRPILEAFYSFSEESLLSSWIHLRPYDQTQEPIFPTELLNLTPKNLFYKGIRINWYAPTKLKVLLDLIQSYPDFMIIGRGALTGLLKRTSNNPHNVLMSVQSIEELRQFRFEGDKLTIGSALTVSEFEEVFRNVADTRCKKLFPKIPSL